MIQVGGYKPSTVIDFDIPTKYGLRQTIADTLGIGGIMRGLRTIPVLLDICHDMEEVCPDVTFLQYTNPMGKRGFCIFGCHERAQRTQSGFSRPAPRNFLLLFRPFCALWALSRQRGNGERF